MLDEVVIEQIPPGSNLNQEENLFVRAFSHEYRNQTHLKDQQRLREVFQIARRDFQNPSFHFYRAFYNEIPIGFIAFCPTERLKEIHVAHLAVDPEHQGLGLGKKLISLISEKITDALKLVLITRKENFGSRAFYEKLGFCLSDFRDDDYDTEAFQGYELSLKKKLS